MNTEQEQRLERWLDRELRQLPDLPAPAALVHRVMLAVHHRRSLPWYRRPWPAWPPACQILSMFLLTALAGLAIATAIHPAWMPGWAGLGQQLRHYDEIGRGLLGVGTVLFDALLLLCEAVGRHFFLIGACLVLAGYLFAVAILSACYQLAFQQR